MFEQFSHLVSLEHRFDRGWLPRERGGFLGQQQALVLAADGKLELQPQQSGGGGDLDGSSGPSASTSEG
jgi:hypothetical protein